MSFDVPPQEILSKDSVTVAVDAVVYFRISNAIASVSNVEDYARSTRLLAATTLRNVLGIKKPPPKLWLLSFKAYTQTNSGTKNI